MGVLGVCDDEAGVLVAVVDELDDGWLDPIDWAATDQVLPLLDPIVTWLLADEEDEGAADDEETE